MEAVLIIAIYVLMLALPAAIVTAVLAVLVRVSGLARLGRVLWIVAGSIVPAAMAFYGFVRSWPWPWRRPDALYDMIPPGPGLLLSAFPTWLLSLAVSWIVLRRGKVDGN